MRANSQLALLVFMTSLLGTGVDSAAAAGSGGAALPQSTTSLPPSHVAPGSGGARPRAPDSDHPVLARLDVSRRNVIAFGQPVRISFLIRDRSHRVTARIEFVRQRDGHVVYRAHLGRIRTGVVQTFSWRGTEGGNVQADGDYRIRIRAIDRAGHRLRRGQASTKAPLIAFRSHVFPVVGPHNMDGAELHFGAKRHGHTHAGQDIQAKLGTPIVAPRGGTISARGFDAVGAGNYLVLDAAGEDFDYVFMHLENEGIRVSKGDRVTAGERLGNVGQTGDATGPHLHFEMWQGAWFAGGKAIDPFPALRSWDRSTS